MCNLYRVRSGPGDILVLTRAMANQAGNLEPRDIYPDRAAPIVRHDDETGGLVLTTARWGMPSSRKALLDAKTKRVEKLRAKGHVIDDEAIKPYLELEPDSRTANARNTSS
jgi:putative SOS response-associated peptidase YedK